MEQPSIREQHLQADADSARQQSYNMTVEARREKAKADRLRAVNAILLEALREVTEELASCLVRESDAGGDYGDLRTDDKALLARAREAIEEAKK